MVTCKEKIHFTKSYETFRNYYPNLSSLIDNDGSSNLGRTCLKDLRASKLENFSTNGSTRFNVAVFIRVRE